MVSFVNGDKANFHEIFKIFVVKNETMRHMGLKLCIGDKIHKYHKRTKFHQNPRDDPKFLTCNDPFVNLVTSGSNLGLARIIIQVSGSSGSVVVTRLQHWL